MLRFVLELAHVARPLVVDPTVAVVADAAELLRLQDAQELGARAADVAEQLVLRRRTS